jgi:putative acetyltransferase
MSLQAQIAAVRAHSRRLVRELGFLSERHALCGVSPLQCHCLIELAQRGRLQVGELADLLRVDKSNVSRAVAELERDGLLESVPHDGDQRSKPLELTPLGRERLSELQERSDAQVRAALSLLNAAERATVLEGIALYERALHRSAALRDIAVRPIEARDEAQMAQIIRSVMTEFGAVGGGFSIQDAEVDSMWRSYQQPRWAYFVAERSGRLIGGAGIAPLERGASHTCELKKMYVLDEGRGIGLGKALLDACLEAARNAGFSECYLETLGRMTQARHLYEKNGFAPIAAPLGNTGHFGCDRWYVRKL